MPRLAQTTTPHLDLVQQITRLESLIQQCRRDALGYAKEIGDLLRTVDPKDRAAVAREAGITGRTSRFDYVQISEHWSSVLDCRSIRQALKLMRQGDPRPVDLRDVPLPFDDRCVNDGHVGLPIGECAVTSGPLGRTPDVVPRLPD